MNRKRPDPKPKPSKKKLFFMIGGAVLFYMYTQMYQPKIEKIKKAKRKYQAALEQVKLKKAEFPLLMIREEEKEKKLQVQKELQAKLEEAEQKLFSRNDLPEIVKRFVEKEALSLETLKIQSIEMGEAKDFDFFTGQSLNLGLKTNYLEFMKFLHHLETVSDYLKPGKVLLQSDPETGLLDASIEIVLYLNKKKNFKKKESSFALKGGPSFEMTFKNSNFLPDVFIEADEDEIIVEEPTETPKEIPVEGVIWTGDAPVVIIKNEIYKIGEVFEGNKILNIDAEKVLFQKDSLKFNYHFKEGRILNP